MEIKSIYSAEFKRYGTIIEGIDGSSLYEKLDEVLTLPEHGTAYLPDIPELDALPVFEALKKDVYGDMPIQIGCCYGSNRKLNALEYHRGMEVNGAKTDFVLLLGRIEDIEEGKISSDKVVAFRVPRGVLVGIYETTLHYAPCGDAFRVVVVLPEGTNTDLDAPCGMLWARNKWLLAHPDTDEAKNGAYIGITGENIELDTL